MRPSLIAACCTLGLTLAGCSSDNNSIEIPVVPAPEPTPAPVIPASRIIFNPIADNLPLPNDIVYFFLEQTDDGTLEVPSEVGAQNAGQQPNFAVPATTLGGLDGWSVQHAFLFSTEHPGEGVSLDPDSVMQAGAIRIFEATLGGDDRSEACADMPERSGCMVGEELVYGEDFMAVVDGGNISVVPLRVFNQNSSYYVVATDMMMDSEGRSIMPSETYIGFKGDADTAPLENPTELAIQRLINSYESVLEEQAGVNPDSIIFSFTFTTQTTNDIMDQVKHLQIGDYASAVTSGMDPAMAAAEYLPVVTLTESGVDNAFDALAMQLLEPEQLNLLTAAGLNTCEGIVTALQDPTSAAFAAASDIFPLVGPFCAASVHSGTVDLPYYLSTSDPIFDRWRGACTNSLALETLGADNIPALIQDGSVTLGANNDLCQQFTNGHLQDLDLSGLGISDLRHVTGLSPIPARNGRNPDGTETLEVQITVPNVELVNMIAASNDDVMPISQPEAGWPVVIMSHGITSRKEDMLALTGTLSVAGFATVAIDQPLHGSRGFVLPNGATINATVGAGGDISHYLNLNNLLTARDNNRQGMTDLLGLRLGLHTVVGNMESSVNLDASNVFLTGHSLGAIVGATTVAMANVSLAEVDPNLAQFDDLYQIKATSLHTPVGGFSRSVLDSATFGDLIEASLFERISPDFRTFLASYAEANGVTLRQALVPAFIQFRAAFTPEQAASAAANLVGFAFLAQAALDSSDPNAYAHLLADTPVHITEIVGGGTNDDNTTAMTDQILPNTTILPLAGTEGFVGVLGLEAVSSTSQGSGLVRISSGNHSSLLLPTPSAAATVEMQRQMAMFFRTTLAGEPTIVITDSSVVMP